MVQFVFLSFRVNHFSKSRAKLNIIGTNIRLNAVEEMSPPITVIAIGERNGPPINAMGSIPASMAIDVIMIG